ncbi:hypothetical protein ACT17_32625 [Mycolicibacterium conceptionense]|uniref:Uncharacterized protein n=1 Tax=Mycolicibacterium conceptionense TaxID=451644 RepID=A0A0J8TX04_9MYCO|nr:hypothetical protein [Mycolicibacterium conceptionense]KMV13928.1 hypothetical protein ACT17_32625 [Mycolicibacterium conceptionense]
MSDPIYIGAGIPDVEGSDEHGPFLRMHISPSHAAHCSACGRQTEVVIARDPDTDNEAWFGLCCDAQGDDLPDDQRFPFGR